MNPWQMLQTDFATFVDGSRDGNVSGPTSQQGSRCQLAGRTQGYIELIQTWHRLLLHQLIVSS